MTPAEYAAYNRVVAVVENAPLSPLSPNDPAILKRLVTAGEFVDDAFFDGWMSDQDWAGMRTQLVADLTGLGYDARGLPVDSIVAGLRQLARSAGVSRPLSDQIQADKARLSDDQMAPQPLPARLVVPAGVVVTQSLPGFVRSRRGR